MRFIPVMHKRGQMPIPRPENLIPLNKRTKEAQREIRSKGGKASAEKKREIKKMSEIYSDFLAEEYEIQISEDVKKKMSGVKLLKYTMQKVFEQGGAPAVSLLKEVREGTEGSKLKIGGLNGDAIPFEYVDPPAADASTE